jgi:drug/metabolite transporter (DMT)-like permease
MWARPLLGPEPDCHPTAQRVLVGVVWLMLAATLVGVICAWVAIARGPVPVTSILLSFALVVTLLLSESVGDAIRTPWSTHTDFCNCKPQ